MRTSALFGTKNFGIFEIYGVSTWKGGVEKSIFRDFVRTSLMDGPFSNTNKTMLMLKKYNFVQNILY